MHVPNDTPPLRCFIDVGYSDPVVRRVAIQELVQDI